MYGLRTVIHLLQGFLDSLRYYLVGVNDVPLIWHLLCVDHSLFCNTSLGGVLLSRSELVCYCRGRDCCAEQSVLCRLQGLSVCASACTFISTTTWFLFAFLWFRRCAVFFGVEGDRRLFVGTWLATFQIVAMGSSALIQIKLTVTALALACRFQVNFFSSTLYVPSIAQIRDILKKIKYLWKRHHHNKYRKPLILGVAFLVFIVTSDIFSNTLWLPD